MDPVPFAQFMKRRLQEARPRCLACRRPIANAPVAQSSKRHGSFDVIVEWRICNCGAFSRTERIRRLV